MHLVIRHSLPLAAVTLGLALAGCGQSLVPVAGTVMLDGKPLTGAAGAVMFVPVQGGPAGSSPLNADGSYSLRTGAVPGIAPGDYEVGITAMTPLAAPTGPVDVEEIPKPLIPPRYADPKSSGLKFTISSGQTGLNLPVQSK